MVALHAAWMMHDKGWSHLSRGQVERLFVLAGRGVADVALPPAR
jgi:hypothetical protein